jgi:hypothetical protein
MCPVATHGHLTSDSICIALKNIARCIFLKFIKNTNKKIWKASSSSAGSAHGTKTDSPRALPSYKFQTNYEKEVTSCSFPFFLKCYSRPRCREGGTEV